MQELDQVLAEAEDVAGTVPEPQPGGEEGQELQRDVAGAREGVREAGTYTRPRYSST